MFLITWKLDGAENFWLIIFPGGSTIRRPAKVGSGEMVVLIDLEDKTGSNVGENNVLHRKSNCWMP